MKNVDVVVIGAGNGGLVSAIRVLQQGYSCLVLEKHNIPGGFATSFKRGRFEFEASLHELNDFGTADNAGDLRVLFDELGVTDKIDWVQSNEAYRLLTLDEKEPMDVAMPLGVNEYIEAMVKACPESKTSMEKFISLCDEIVRAQAYSNSVNGKTDSKYMVEHFPNFVRCGSYSVNEVLKVLKMPKKAKDILSAYWCYLGADLDTMSFIHYASMVYRYLTRKVSIPVNRSHEISLALAERIMELGGEIWYNSEVTEIVMRGKTVQGVRLADGTTIGSHHIIANCAPHVVFGKMMKARYVPKYQLQLANARKFAGRGFTVFLGLNKSAEELGITHHNYFIYDTNDTVKQYELMERIVTNRAQATVCLNHALPNCSPKGTCMLYMTTLFTSNDWKNVTKTDYVKVKEMVASNLIDAFEKATHTSIRPYIEQIEIATPLTYARYCGHPEGVIYGYESQYYDGLMPRLLMMQDDASTCPGLRFAGGYSMRLSGYSSAYHSGDIVGRQTVGDLKKEVQA